MLLKRYLAREKGAVLPFFAACVTILVGFCAISLDAGRLYTTKLSLRNVADAAALAGVRHLPSQPSEAIEAAIHYAQVNGIDPSRVRVQVEGPTGQRLRVIVERVVRVDFAGVLVSNSEAIAAGSVAVAGACSALVGAQPFGVQQTAFVTGERYVLKLDSKSDPGPTSGNFHALALGLRGANNYRDNVQYGYQGKLSVGDMVDTETGNMEGPTQQGLTPRLNADPAATYDNHSPSSPRVLLVPVIRSFEVNGRKQVEIMGFASFFLEDYRVVSNGSDEIVGRFLRRVTPGQIDETGNVPNYGTTSVKLIR